MTVSPVPDLERLLSSTSCGLPTRSVAIRLLLLCALGWNPPVRAQDAAGAPAEPLPFPGLLKQAERKAGNPLATYAAMLELDDRYRRSPAFSAIYLEVRCNYE